MPPITVQIKSSKWSVTFTGPDGQIRVGPWLLFNSHEEVRTKVLRWGNISTEELERHERHILVWGVSTVNVNLSHEQFNALIRRGVGWPWNGYELLQMKRTGKYPARRLGGRSFGI